MRHDNLPPLETLIERARKNAFTIEDIDWSESIDPQKYWSPDIISPLYHLPSFSKLPKEMQLRYNQLFAMGVCEQFVWLEENILVQVLQKVLRKADVPVDLRTALEIFIEEEEKHTEMFWRTLEKAEPNWYNPSERKFKLYNISKPQQFLLDIVLSMPNTFLLWIWTAIFFEERTVDYCKQYLVFDKKNKEKLDSTFLTIHRYHYKDEVRHYQMDQHLLKHLYDPQPKWKRVLCGKMFYKLIESYTSPRRTSIRVLEILKKEYSIEHHPLLDKLESELPLLSKSESFQEVGFSKKALKKTLKLFAQYSELDQLWELFMHENKEDHLLDEV